MRTFFALSLLLLLSFTTGCTSPTAPKQEPVIDLFSSTCYGTCPSYRIVAYPSGLVHFLPLRFTATTEQKTRLIDPKVIEQLLKEATAVDFFNRQDSYTTITIPGVGEVTHSDGQGITLSITKEGKTKSVYMYLGEPQELIDLRKHIVEATILASWIE